MNLFDKITCDCCPPNRHEELDIVGIPIDYRSSTQYIGDNTITFHREDRSYVFMNCRDCFKDLDPLKDIMKDRVCNSCSDKNEEFWNSIIKLLEDSYSEV